MTADLEFVLANPANEADLRRLLRETPLAGDIHVALEREPNALHAAGVSGDVHELILCYGDAGTRLLGAGARFELDAWINGEAQHIGYLGELRVAGGLRQRRTMLIEAYRALRRHHEAGSAPFYLTTIISANTGTRRLLEAGLGDMPVYAPLEPMVTFTMPAGPGARRRRGAPSLDAAGTAELSAIAEQLREHGRDYQFYPLWTEATLRSPERCRGLAAGDFLLCRRDGRISGCLALWDQRAFKQTVIRSYARRLARLRPAVNLVAPLLGRPRLPAPGARLESAFASHVAVAPDDADTLEALLREACRRAIRRGLDYLMIAFAERNPLAAVIRNRFTCHSYVSMIYVVYWDDGRDAAAGLDGRIPHPEVAIL